MTQSEPLALQQVRDELRRLYTGRITGTGNNPDINFLSKALAAFLIHKLSQCTIEESVDAVVDGGNDGGIDAVFIKDDVLWLVQSKFIQDGLGQPNLGDVTKFKEGVENIVTARFDIMQRNEAFERVIPKVQACLESSEAVIRAYLVYSGDSVIEQDRRHLFQGLENRLNSPANPDFLRFLPYNLTSMRDLLLPAPEDREVPPITLTMYSPASLENVDHGPHRMWYGLVKVQDLADLYAEYGDKLIADNIRGFKGNTSVNEKITQSLTEQPDLFLYLNNGLTAYCQRLGVPAVDRTRTDAKRLEIRGISIVNGAQTLGVIAHVRQIRSDAMPGYVFMRIISMERAEDERELGQKITFSTNFQNQVHWRDFASLDTHQASLAEQLELSGIHYHYRDADSIPDPDDENFDFQEALLALACLESDASCDLCAKAQSNRQALASPEKVYPEPYPSRYQRLFRPDRPAEQVWRAVQALRTVKTRMTENVRQSDGQRKAFFKDAKYLVAHLLFIRKETHKGTTLTLTPAEVEAVRNETDTISEALWASYNAEATLNTRSPASVFSSATECRFLKGKAMQRLTARPSIPSQTNGNQSQTDTLES